jgi:hypothetical protein
LGVEVLPESLKTPTLLHVLYTNKDKIQAHKEYQTRIANSKITENRVRELIIRLTGNQLLADKAAAKFSLADSKKERK